MRRKKPTNNEQFSSNCVENELKLQRIKDLAALRVVKSWEKGKKFKYVPHPELPRTWKRVLIG